MTKSNLFIDPNPEQVYIPTTSLVEPAEQQIAELFTDASDAAHSLAGFIFRNSINIARYQRSLVQYPVKKAHYQRLQRVARHAAQVRVQHTAEENGGSGIIEGVRAILQTADWDSAPDMPIAIINKSDGEAGTAYALCFAPSFSSWYQNGGMEGVPLQPGEPSYASWKCGGGPHDEDRPISTTTA